MAVKMISTKRIQIEKSKRMIFIAVTVAAVVASFSVVTTKFLWDLGQHYNQVAGLKEEAKDTLEQNVENAKLLTQSFTEFDNDQDGVTSQTVLDALPSKYDFPALVTSLEGLATRSGMSVVGVSGEDLGDSAENISTNPLPIEMEVNLGLRGKYEDLQSFLQNLQFSIRPFSVTSLEIRGSDELLTADLTVVTYYQPSIDLEVRTEELNKATRSQNINAEEASND